MKKNTDKISHTAYLKGAGLWDDFKSAGSKIWSGLKTVEEWARKHKPLATIENYIPGVTNLPYIGKLIKVGAFGGYNIPHPKKMPKRLKMKKAKK
jgi:hypothetical protein